MKAIPAIYDHSENPAPELSERRPFHAPVFPKYVPQQLAPDLIAFLADIESVCRNHGISIGHEDTHGAFNLVTFNEDYMSWLNAAYDERKES